MKRSTAALVLLFLIGAALRIAGANHALWLDEIWSCDIAASLSTPLGVLTEPPARVDNNHPLNTVWLTLIGNRQPYWLYHLPSLLAGVGTLILIGVAAERRSRAAALWAMAMAAVSLPLIQFSDEARGYALAAFFAALMFDAAERYLARPNVRPAAVFLAGCILGGLSHLLILHVYVGLCAMTGWTLWQRCKTSRPFGSFAILHAGPLLFWLLYSALFVGRLHFGGGAPRWYLLPSLCASLAGLLGWIGPAAWLPAAGLIVGLIALAVSLARRGESTWIFVIVGCFLSPILLVAPQWFFSPSPVPMATRYFLPLVPIVIVLLGDAIARHRWLAAIAGLVLIVNLVNDARLITIGLGDGLAVVRYIHAHDPAAGGVLADHPLRTKMVLDFYADRAGLSTSFHVYDLTEHLDAPAAASRWLVVHGRGGAAPAGIDIGSGKPFTRVAQFGSFGLSGYDFEIYRRSD